jgi:putative ABC transport system ATP-binding protein
MALLELVEVSKIYDCGAKRVAAVDRVSLQVEPGEIVLMVGPSGSGKTSLLSLMGCILRPTSGQVIVDGIDVTQLNQAELSRVRAAYFGFVFQSYNLVEALTALENVEYTLQMKYRDYPGAREEAGRLLAAVGLADRQHHKPNALSGGQCQRVAIARALAGSPRVIFCDEPTAALDGTTAMAVMEPLTRAAREQGHAVVLVSHDLRLERLADRTIHVEDGRISAETQSPHRPGVVCSHGSPLPARPLMDAFPQRSQEPVSEVPPAVPRTRFRRLFKRAGQVSFVAAVVATTSYLAVPPLAAVGPTDERTTTQAEEVRLTASGKVEAVSGLAALGLDQTLSVC